MRGCFGAKRGFIRFVLVFSMYVLLSIMVPWR